MFSIHIAFVFISDLIKMLILVVFADSRYKWAIKAGGWWNYQHVCSERLHIINWWYTKEVNVLPFLLFMISFYAGIFSLCMGESSVSCNALMIMTWTKDSNKIYILSSKYMLQVSHLLLYVEAGFLKGKPCKKPILLCYMGLNTG